MTDTLPPTEQRNGASRHLGTLDTASVVALMNQEEHRALAAVEIAAAQLADAAEHVASCIENGGRVVLLGAGTSGRLAVQEIAELPPTFGISPDLFIAMVAGSAGIGPAAITRSEDDTQAATRALAAAGIGANDAVIGIAASGTTPFVRAGVITAARASAWTCGIANNPGAPLLGDAAAAVLLDTGPEVLTGSTRLKAGTAQKLALNRITTAAMVRLGKVVENHMIDLVGSNEKMKLRSIRILGDLAGIQEVDARRLLENHAWHVREALEAWADLQKSTPRA